MNRINHIRPRFSISFRNYNFSCQLFFGKRYFSRLPTHSSLILFSNQKSLNSHKSDLSFSPFLFTIRFRGQDRSSISHQQFPSSKSQATPQPIKTPKPLRFRLLLLWFIFGTTCGWFLHLYSKYSVIINSFKDDDFQPEIPPPPFQPDPKPSPKPPKQDSKKVPDEEPLPNSDSPSKPINKRAHLNILADVAEAVMPSVVFIESASIK